MNSRVWLCVFLCLAPLAAPAQETPAAFTAPVIGILDVDEVMQDAIAAKSVRTQADKYRQDFQSQGAGEERNLRAAQQQIEQERKVLSPEVLSEKARAFDASVADYQRREMARRRAFEKSFNQAMGKVQQAMFEAARKVAQEHGVNIILPRSQVILFDDKINMSKEIIALMDKALPSVEFPPPQVEGDQQGAPPANPALKKKN